jgi:prepilin-type N-terminal cleavage/methylation domain-containing protein
MLKIKPGFSLIEIMIAIAIIGMVMAIGYPNYRARVVQAERDTFFANLKGLIEFARQRAMVGNLVTKVTFDIANRTAWIEQQTGQKDAKGESAFARIKSASVRAVITWDARFVFRSFIIEGVDEFAASGGGTRSTEEVWFFIVPEGTVQEVSFTIADTKDIIRNKAHQFLCTINPFSGILKVEDV